ncbi:hypothetical protein NN561_018100 [Cricetulus griseus]
MREGQRGAGEREPGGGKRGLVNDSLDVPVSRQGWRDPRDWTSVWKAVRSAIAPTWEPGIGCIEKQRFQSPLTPSVSGKELLSRLASNTQGPPAAE